MTRYPCPCCGYLTLLEEPPGTFDICPVCGWEDDNVQFRNPDWAVGANKVSLNRARLNFRSLGYAAETAKHIVRPPTADELPNRN